MKIKVFGTAHINGTSAKTGRPYDLTIVHTLMPSRGVVGYAAKQIMLNYSEYPQENISVNAEYEVEFDNTGYPVVFRAVK